MNPSNITQIPAPSVDLTELSYRRSAWELLLDYGISILTLLLLLPLIVAAIILVKAVSPGPAIFKQRRIGLGGKAFMIYKLRTMFLDARTEEHETHAMELMKSNRPMTKMDTNGDSRLIPFGRFLRNSAIDELPQLINVLKGQMSIVGPRPCVPSEYAAYSPSDKRRFETLPGITGLWQVSGKNALTFEQMIDCDVQYILRKRCSMYLSIILKTPSVLFKQVRESRCYMEIERISRQPEHVQFEKKATS